ncbi:MAG: hypothetical protein ABR955_09520 [Verrucomicrobiota bacterium]|jgi:hypothetical protein
MTNKKNILILSCLLGIAVSAGGQTFTPTTGSIAGNSSAGWISGSTGYRPETSSGSYSLGYTGIATPLFAVTAVPEPSTAVYVLLCGVTFVILARRKST